MNDTDQCARCGGWLERTGMSYCVVCCWLQDGHDWVHPDNATRRCLSCGITEPYESYGAAGMPFQP
jgi:hypothetical protein